MDKKMDAAIIAVVHKQYREMAVQRTAKTTDTHIDRYTRRRSGFFMLMVLTGHDIILLKRKQSA